LTDEEREAAERAASGEQEEEVEAQPISAEETADLQRLIEEQRAEEQRIKLELVEAAEAELKAKQEEA